MRGSTPPAHFRLPIGRLRSSESEKIGLLILLMRASFSRRCNWLDFIRLSLGPICFIRAIMRSPGSMTGAAHPNAGGTAPAHPLAVIRQWVGC